ncbi:hypothetical protein IED13_04630 [Bosea sp. SSUT16]|uniref:Uncharacterized protein n=2 Tax=Boseaceae TaxID=2831100 RepID=A0A927E6I9_9HYPH|nr:hypothetical protein [Bosea spartocytisi]MBD3844972.1 hypothetical protein [Bosea spartocytisi]MCT4471174.1 hypothetical protein [Bosea spartocytisi]
MQHHSANQWRNGSDPDNFMIIAGILFLLGILIGLSYGYPAIVIASAALTLFFFPLWLIRGELSFFTLFIWIGYLFALQSGFLLGSYFATPDDEA